MALIGIPVKVRTPEGGESALFVFVLRSYGNVFGGGVGDDVDGGAKNDW